MVPAAGPPGASPSTSSSSGSGGASWELRGSFLLLVVRPGAPSSVLAPSSDALCS